MLGIVLVLTLLADYRLSNSTTTTTNSSVATGDGSTTQNMSPLACVNYVERIAQVISRNGANHHLAVPLLRLVRIVAKSPLLAVSVKHVTLDHMLTYMRQRMQDDDGVVFYQETFCGVVVSLFSSGTPVPSTTTTGFLYLLRDLLLRHTSTQSSDGPTRETIYEALIAVFKTCGDDIADFPLGSSEFDIVLGDLRDVNGLGRMGPASVLSLLQQWFAVTNDADIMQLLTYTRVEGICELFCTGDKSSRSREILIPWTQMVTSLAARGPEVAQLFVGGFDMLELVC